MFHRNLKSKNNEWTPSMNCSICKKIAKNPKIYAKNYIATPQRKILKQRNKEKEKEKEKEKLKKTLRVLKTSLLATFRKRRERERGKKGATKRPIVQLSP